MEVLTETFTDILVQGVQGVRGVQALLSFYPLQARGVISDLCTEANHVIKGKGILSSSTKIEEINSDPYLYTHLRFQYMHICPKLLKLAPAS